jgi:hypothetical protein
MRFERNLVSVILAVLMTLLFLISCKRESDQGKGRLLARVFDNYLYEQDITGIYAGDMSPEDSAILRKAFIDKWIEDQLLASNAEDNLPGTAMEEVENQVVEYRNSLMAYYFEKEYASQHLDTLVTEEEIRTYYEENKNNFLLTDNIIRVSFVKLPRNAPNLRLVKEYLQSENSQDIERLRDYCQRHAENFYIDNESWILFDDLLRVVPIQTYNQEAYLENNRFIEFEDSDFRYLVHIKGFRIKASISPLSFETSNIHSLILNKRKQEVVERLRNDIVRRGVEEKSFEVYGD